VPPTTAGGKRGGRCCHARGAGSAAHTYVTRTRTPAPLSRCLPRFVPAQEKDYRPTVTVKQILVGIQDLVRVCRELRESSRKEG
jgi:hypothetical protein